MPPEEEPHDRPRREWTLVPRSHARGGPSFWSTSTGIVTAVASLLTAVTGLILALGQIGVIGGDDAGAIPGAPTLTVSTVPASEMSADEEQRLLERVPAGIRGDCGTTAYHDDRALAAVDCSQADVSDLHYELFASTGDLDDHWAERRDAAGGADGDCAKGETGESEYTGPGEQVEGDYVCYEAEGRAWMEWTHVPTLIYSYAARADRDIAALYRWWLDVPGPD